MSASQPKMKARWSSWTGLVIVLAAGCGSGSPNAPDAGGSDGRSDTTMDAPGDQMMPDAPADTGGDQAGSDAPADTAASDVPAGDDGASATDVPSDGPDGGAADADAGTASDAGTTTDSGTASDAGTTTDSGTTTDAGTASDGGPDAGTASGPCGVLGWGLQTIAALAPHGGSSVAFATPGGVLELRRWSDGTRLGINNGFLGATAVAYSGDGTIFAAATSDAVKLWRVADGTLLSTAPQLANSKSIALSNDGSVLVGQGLTSIVVVRASGVQTIPLQNGAGVAISPDGTVVAAVSLSGIGSSTAYLDTAWRVSDGQQLWSVSAGTVIGNGLPLPRVAFSPDGTLVAFGGSSLGRGVHRVSDGSTVFSAGEPLAFTDDGLGLLTYPGTAPAGSYSLVRVSDGVTVRTFNLASGATILAGGFSTGTTTLAVVQPSASEDHQLFVDGTLARSIAHPGGRGMMNGVALSPDGVWLAAADDAAKIRIWKTATATVAATIGGGPLRRQVAAFSADSKQLATVGTHSVTIYRLTDSAGPPLAAPQQLRTITVDAHAVALSADGGLIATGDDDNTAKIWSGTNGALLQTLWNLSGHTSAVDGITFSPDGSVVATASADGTIKLWRTTDGGELRTITTGASSVDTVRFSSDGAWVLSSQFPGSAAKIWNAVDGTLVRSVPGLSNAVISAPASTLFIGTSGSAAPAIARVGLPDFSDRGVLPQSATSAGVRFLDVTPSGSLLAGGTDANVVRLWCSP